MLGPNENLCLGLGKVARLGLLSYRGNASDTLSHLEGWDGNLDAVEQFRCEERGGRRECIRPVPSLHFQLRAKDQIYGCSRI